MNEKLSQKAGSMWPPSQGLSIGVRLALSTIFVVTISMGSIAITQQVSDIEKDRLLISEVMKSTLIPLAARLESSVSLDVMREEIIEYHRAFLSRGYPDHEINIYDSKGEAILIQESTGLNGHGAELISANIRIDSHLFDDKHGVLRVTKHIDKYEELLGNTWLLWATHFGVTLGVILLFLVITIYYQVTKPMNRLIQGVEKMEMGYWGPVDIRSGAWELRWLSWRFGNMVQEVRSAVMHLFEAEQKAKHIVENRKKNFTSDEVNHHEDVILDKSQFLNTATYQELLALCERLELASVQDQESVRIASGIWKNEAIEANQLGYHQLKARLEDAALKLTKPDIYKDVDEKLRVIKESWQEWPSEIEMNLRVKLKDNHIPIVKIEHRVKHTAGVWLKMKSKNLYLDEVYDLFALRLILPTEADCYAATSVVHQVYKPSVSRFKDYIARPKGNGYRGIHTCVVSAKGLIFEIQIRSRSMDHQAEKGESAHWKYKSDTSTLTTTDYENSLWNKIRSRVFSFGRLN